MNVTDFARHVLGKPALPVATARAALRFLEGKGPMPAPPLTAKQVYQTARRVLAEADFAEATAVRRRLTEQRARRRPQQIWLIEGWKQGEAKILNHVLKNVKILGATSRNGRRYTPEAMAAAVGLYERCRVNVDHLDRRRAGIRPLSSRFGKLVNVRHKPDGLYADLRYNPNHALAATIEWFAEHDPQSIGLSHDALGSGRTDPDGTYVVDRIESVRSVDIVAEPATTGGLFGDD